MPTNKLVMLLMILTCLSGLAAEVSINVNVHVLYHVSVLGPG